MRFHDLDQEISLRLRSMALVRAAPNLTALTLQLYTVQTIDLLSSNSLKYLALHITLKGGWPNKFPDLRACPMLESLKVVVEEAADTSSYLYDSAIHRPDICLSHMPKLRHVELDEQALPRERLALPSSCKLFTKLRGYPTEFSWGNSLESTSHHTAILCLTFYAIRAWPAVLGCFRLQLLVLEHTSSVMRCNPVLDLASLQSIPHVRLYSRSFLDLVLTEGSWQSLDIFSERGLWVEFSDMDAFVTSTKLFSFCYGYMDNHDLATREKSAAMVDNMEAICSKHDMECYKTSHSLSFLSDLTRVTRISNRKLKPPLDTQEALQAFIPWVHQLEASNMLAPYEDFWPQDPCKSLSGRHKYQYEILE